MGIAYSRCPSRLAGNIVVTFVWLSSNWAIIRFFFSKNKITKIMTSNENVLNGSWSRLSLDFGCCSYWGNFTGARSKIKKDWILTRITELIKKRQILKFNFFLISLLTHLLAFVFFPGQYSVAVVSTVPSKKCRLIAKFSHLYKPHFNFKRNPNQPLTVCHVQLIPTFQRPARPMLWEQVVIWLQCWPYNKMLACPGCTLPLA